MQVVVTGAPFAGSHRVARLLNLMGIYFGPEGSALDYAQPEQNVGCWERTDIRELHDNLLRGLGLSWEQPGAYPLTLPTQSAERFQQGAAARLHDLDAHRPCLLHDSRLPLVLGYWLPLLEVPVGVHVYHSPLQTAQRIHEQEGLPLHIGLALWEYYHLAALQSWGSAPLLLIDYAQLCAEPEAQILHLYEQLQVVGVKARLPNERERQAFADKLPAALRDEPAVLAEYLNQGQQQLFALLQQNCTELSQYRKLSLSAGSAQILLDHAEIQHEWQQIQAAQSQQLAQQQQLAADLSQAQQEAQALRAQLQAQRVGLDKQQQQAQQFSELQSLRAQLEQQLSKQQAELAQQQQSLQKAQQAQRHYQAEAQHLKRWISQLHNDTQDLLQSLRWKIGDTLIRQVERVLMRPQVKLAADHMLEVFQEFETWQKQPKQNGQAGVAASMLPRYQISARPLIQADQHPRKVFTHSLSPLSNEQRPGVSLIILNRDGADFLRDLFSSFCEHIRYEPLEFLIVDHGSQDESCAIIEKYQQQLSIQLFRFEENRSFSSSNNFAARRANYEHLVFLNNDIIFEQPDIFEHLVQALNDQSIGLAGLRLMYPADHATHPGQVQHNGIQFYADEEFRFYRPYNLQHQWQGHKPNALYLLPAVTAALVMCRKTEFLELGGFCESYFYGYEDVDLCLSYFKQLGKASALVDSASAIHNESASQKQDKRDAIRQRRLKNIETLRQRYGYGLKRAARQDQMQVQHFWTNQVPVVGFIVTEVNEDVGAGDYFTALELATALEAEFGWDIRYIPVRHSDEDPYCMEGIDILIVMVTGYAIDKLYHCKPNLIKIAWMRNWFDRWAQQDSFDEHDIFLCSSQKAADHIRDEYGKEAHVLRIAANHKRFYPDASVKKDLDYCFTGSYWNVKRDIQMLDPRKLDYSFEVYGQRWDSHPPFKPFWKGFLSYTDLPGVYHRARLLLDDANHVTKGWGSVNSRVFDALASGTLVITNGELGAEEVFDGELPTYNTVGELESKLKAYLSNPELYQQTIEKLQSRVLSAHTYTHRAYELRDILSHYRRDRFHIALKVPVPKMEVAYEWGDYHFALALKRALVAQGHSVRIDILPEWYGDQCFGDDVAIVLRGLSEYEPQPDQINLMWNISHPDKVSHEEYEKYDHVFVASQSYAESLNKQLKTPVSALLQCTDSSLFYPDQDEEVPEHGVLFIGNSRKQYREIVKHAVEAKLPLNVYGTRWESLIDAQYIKGEHVENTKLRKYYSRCQVLLNDHWPSMREQGFISNRLFDAGACGAVIITDKVAGLEAVFGDAVLTYDDSADSLRAVISDIQANPQRITEIRQAIQEKVRSEHTFTQRAERLQEVILQLDQERGFTQLGWVSQVA